MCQNLANKLLETVNFNIGEIKEIVMKGGDKKRDIKHMDKMFNR